MAIAYVQSAIVNFSANTSSFTVSLTGVTAGDALILPLILVQGTVSTVSSIADGVNTWHYSTSATQNPPYIAGADSGNQGVALVAWALAVASGSVTVTVTMAGAGDIFANGSLAEFSGVSSETAGLATDPGTSANPILMSALTVPASGLAVVALEGEFGQGGISPNSPLVSIPADTGSFSFYALTSGSYQASLANTSTRTWVAAAAAFAPAAAHASGMLLAGYV